jgi:hypothetical protein
MFSPYPRFGAYEKDEAGCSEQALRDYKLVDSWK